MGKELLNTEMDFDSAIKTCKGYQPMSPSLQTVIPVYNGRTVTSSDHLKSSSTGDFKRDTHTRPSSSSADVRHQQRNDPSKTTAVRVRPPTPIWVEGRYTPIFDTSPIVFHSEDKQDTSTRAVKVADPKPQKTSKMKTFFNGVSRFLSEKRHHRKGWTRF